jgi:capsular exopolysaccharide synthesis family protein
MIPGLKKRVFNLHDVFMYLAIARKHFRLMTLLMVFSFLCALVYYVYARPVYYSKALVHMEYLARPIDDEKLFREGHLRVVLKELKAPHIVERTAHKLGLKGSAREIEQKLILKQTIRANSEKNLDFEVWPVSMELAERWPKALLDTFDEYRREKRIHDRDAVTEAYTKEVMEIATQMGQSLDDKFRLRDAHDIARVKIEFQKYTNLPAELAKMGKRLDDMGRVRIQLEDPSLDVIAKLSLINSIQKDPLAASTQLNIGQDIKLNGAGNEGDGAKGDDDNDRQGGNIIVVPSMAPSAQVWQELEKERQRIHNQVTEAGRKYLPGHRIMKELQGQLEAVDSKLATEYKVTRSHFDLEYQELINKRNDLQNNLPKYEEALKNGELVKQKEKIFSMSRLPWERMQSEMQKKMDSIDYGYEKERVDLTFVGITDLRDRPVSPNRGKLLIMGLFMGVALALGVPFLIEYLDHTMTNLEQVESAFQLRGLGIVPKLDNSGAPALIDGEESKETSLVENFRVIRTNLISVGSLTKTPHVLMITSAMPKEGKTVVSSNLAISFAHMGAKTLLIDTDLRRGRMHRLFGYRKSPGLSNVLLDEVKIEDACRPTSHENLHVLSAGKHLDTGTELLGSQKFADLMTDLRGKYDRIVVDTPPVLGLSETSILQKQVDGVLFVIWSGRTPIRNVKAAIEMLQVNGANFYGFVLNRLDLSATQNYYQYYYYSHDYYYNYQPQALERT